MDKDRKVKFKRAFISHIILCVRISTYIITCVLIKYCIQI